MNGITPCLWFDGNAEDAAGFYISIIPDSKITGISHYSEPAAKVSGRKKGSVLTVEFELQKQPFLALNGGPQFQFTPAFSLMVNCSSQDEVDDLWDRLSEGGSEGQCGWLTDKYGVSWQIVPTILGQLLKADRGGESAMKAMLSMKKLDIQTLRDAAREAR